MWPLAQCLWPRYLTALGWDNISGVSSGKGNLCSLIHTTYHKTGDLLACDVFFGEDCRELQVNFRTINVELLESRLFNEAGIRLVVKQCVPHCLVV